ncbi:hypothetical protein NQ314_015097 [Rhamnusium bicolor]|uniref:Uncharacterized protein n=1 Tax=Rhamnusium bicolor TaxID=1586634 RepID=A0AAV8WZ89_9CUCU|nr:hypothetical protein NQ314_015097 [Rhamnusium bicolor]
MESSQAAKYGGCFSGENTVLTSLGVRRKLSELQIGEKILSQDPTTQQLIFSEVILFLDYNPIERREFFKFFLLSGRTFIVTANHLVLSGTFKKYRTVYAKKINIGDNLLVSDSNNTIVEDSVVQIKPIIKTGVYAPLTKVGTLVVNDIIASCYATVDSQSLAHWAFLPVRLVWNIKQSLFRFWSIINKPVISWSNAPTSVTSGRPTGVHWYARMLYATANYLLPSHLYQ